MQYYTSDNHLLILTDRECIYCSPEEVSILEKESHEIEQFQESHLLSVFPKAKKAIIANIKIQKELFEELEMLRPLLRDQVTAHIHDIGEQEKTEDFLVQVHIDLPQKKISKHIQRLERMLQWQKHKEEVSFEKAKSRLISEILEFNHAGFTRCIFHTEATASMRYYIKSNTFYCFGCGESGDVLNVYMKLNDCNLQVAINALS